MKNYLILSLSTFNKNRDTGNIDKSTLLLDNQEIYYYYQMEPVPIKLKKEGKLDKIFALATPQTQKPVPFKLQDDETNYENSPLNFFKERIDFDNVDVTTIDISDVPKGIIEITQKIRKENKNEEINWYVDNHGAFRDIQYIFNAILSLMYRENITPIIYSVPFSDGVSRIEEQKLNINDFISGINEFLNTGHMNSLKRYFDNYQLSNDYDSQLPELVENISNAILLCNMKRFYESIDKLRDWEEQRPNDQNTYLDLFINYIKDDYGDLWNKDKRTNIKTIDWCLKKKFIQQALTIIESHMPDDIVGTQYFNINWNSNIAENRNNGNNYHPNWQLTGNSDSLENLATECKLDFENKNSYILRTWGKNAATGLKETSGENVVYINLDTHKNQLIHLEETMSTSYNTSFYVYQRHNNSNYRYRIQIQCNNLNNTKKQKFKAFMKLHMELKQERNKTNHSISENRYLMDSVCVGIENYVRLANDLNIV